MQQAVINVTLKMFTYNLRKHSAFLTGVLEKKKKIIVISCITTLSTTSSSEVQRVLFA